MFNIIIIQKNPFDIPLGTIDTELSISLTAIESLSSSVNGTGEPS